MGALSVTDLQPIGDEPCVRDLKLSEGLGFSRPTDVRKLIDRHAEELMTHGSLRQVGAMIEAGKGARRAVSEYWLNEPQALLVCMFARTPAAAEIRRQVVAVFLAWRRGELAAPAVAGDLEALAGQAEQMRVRLEALERLGVQLRDGDTSATALALTHIDIWAELRPGRRPKLFGDAEVRAHILETHRQGALDEVLAGMIDRFGPARTPSRSALFRWWKRLDVLRTKRGAQ